MKKVLLVLAFFMLSSTLFAGSLDYLSNQSSKFVMNTASAARTDGADIVAYNPAGTALMGEGLFIDVSNQTMLKFYDQTVESDSLGLDESYSSSKHTWILPNIYLVYNMGEMGIGKMALYANVGIPAGGGDLKWDGTAGTLAAAGTISQTLGQTLNDVDVTLKASSVYYAFGGGVSYAFLNDMVSVSAGARYNMPKRSGSIEGDIVMSGLTVSVDNEYSYDAKGITPIFGFDVRPTKDINIGFRYELETKLKFEYEQDTLKVTNSANIGIINTTIEDNFNVDGKKSNQNLPQIISAGIEYSITPELTAAAAGTFYLMSEADLGGKEDYYGTGYELALGLTYKVLEPLKLVASAMYTDQGAKDSLLESDEEILTVSANPSLNSIFMGCGVIYSVTPGIDLNLALAWTHYFTEDVTTESGLDVNYQKDVYNVAIGVSQKI